MNNENKNANTNENAEKKQKVIMLEEKLKSNLSGVMEKVADMGMLPLPHLTPCACSQRNLIRVSTQTYMRKVVVTKMMRSQRKQC